MPTYEYRCSACEHEFEAFQSIKDAPLRKCPSCAKNTLQRLISGGGAVLFKGSGFYETDYRSSSYKKAAEAESKAASGETKAESKNETKAETKAEAKPAKADKPAPKPASGAASKPAKSDA